MAPAVTAVSKLVASVLVALLLLGALPSSAFANSTATFTLNNNDVHWSTSIGVTGGGWAPGGTAGAGGTGPIVRFNGVPVAYCATSSAGANAGSLQNCSFPVPDDGPGNHHVVTVTDRSGAGPSGVAFTIKAAAITINPTGGAGGATTNVSGQGFGATTAISFTAEGAPAPSSCTSSNTGTFSNCPISIPVGETGSVPIVATDANGRASAPVNYARTLTKGTISPISPAVWGASVTVQGSGWPVSRTGGAGGNGPQIRLNGDLRHTCSTDNKGALTNCSFIVPQIAPGSDHTVTVTDQANSFNTASQPFTINAGAVMLTPTSGTGGTSVTVTGGGWRANATGDARPIVRFNGAEVARCATSGNNLSSCQFQVPPVRGPQTYQVSVTDATVPENTREAPFSVNTPSVSLNPTSGTSGTVTTANGTGFRAGSTVEFMFGNVRSSSTCQTNQWGAFGPCSVTVPALQSTGSVTVTARDLPAGEEQRTATTTFTANTVIQLSQSEAVPNNAASITVTGSGFNTSQTVELQWAAGTAAPTAIPNTSTCATSSTGVLQGCSFQVAHGTPPGAYTVTAAVISGSNRRSASAPLRVFRETNVSVQAVSGTYGGTTTLTATLNRTNNTQTLAGRTLVFSVAGTQVGTQVTDAIGVATLTGVSLGELSVAGSPHANVIRVDFAGDVDHRPSHGTASATITPRTVTGAFTAANKTYDGTGAATITDRSLADVLGGDTVTLTGGTAAFAGKAAGNDQTVTGTGFSLGGADAGNYQLQSTTLTTTANITPKPVTIAVTAADKVYDGTTSATILTRPVTGAVSGDMVTAQGGTAQFGDKNAQNGKTVTVTGLSLTGADAGNYTHNAGATTQADITKRPLAVTATASNKIYDRNRDAEVTLGDNRVPGDELAIGHGQATFDTAAVGVLKPVTVPGITVTGADAGNYTHNTQALAYANITTRGVTVTFTADDKVYDGTTAATVKSHQLDGIRDGDTVDVEGGTVAFNDKNVANDKTVRWSSFVLTGPDAENYSLATDQVTTTADITGRPLAVTATSDGKVYDGTPAASVTLADDRVTGDTLALAYDTATYRSKGAAEDKPIDVDGITVTGASAGNYTWNTETVATATITPATLTVTVDAQDKVYDAGTLTTAALGDDRVAGDELEVEHDEANFEDKHVAAGKTVTVTGISIEGEDAGNYETAPTATGTADITAKAITASFTVPSKTYDQTTTAIIGSAGLTGVEPGDVVAIDGGTATYADKNAATPKTATITGYTLTGADAGNYTVNPTATAPSAITPRSLAVTATGTTRVYDGGTATVVSLSDDRIDGDVLSRSYGAAHFADKHVGTGKAVSVTGIAVGGADAGNYTHNVTASATGSITRRDLEVTATGVSKVYDRTTAAQVNLSDDRVAGDTLTPTYATATFNNRHVGAGKPVSVQGITVVGDDAANYAVNPTATTTASITARPLTVTATGVAKTYDGTDGATVTLSDDRVSGDVLTATYQSAMYNNKNVDTAKPVSVTGIAISGTDAGNYSVNESTATTAAITARQLVVSADGVSRVYDGTQAATVTLSDNRVNGDELTLDYAGASFADKHVGTGKAVAVSGIAVTGADAGNYAANTTASTTAAITAKDVSATFTAAGKTYDGTTTASVVTRTVVGKVSGDAVSLTDGQAVFGNKHVGTGKTVTWSEFALTGADAGNYRLTNESATDTATIAARALTASAIASDKVYDGNRTAQVTLGSNALSGDTVALSHTSALFDSKTVGSNKDVTVSGIAISGGADAGNYTLTGTTATAKAAITAPDALTVTFQADDKTYDGTNTATLKHGSLQIAGVKNGDSVSVSGGTMTFSDETAATGKTVTWTGFSLAGPDASNYSLGSTTATTTATIARRALTVTATASNRMYNALTGASVTMTSAQLIADDDVQFVGTATFADKHVGNDKTVTVNGIAISGDDAANYTVANTSTTTTADITPATLTVSATATPKVYDGSADASVTPSSNRLGTDVVNLSHGQATFSDKHVGTGKTVTVPFIAIAAGGDGGNYVLANTQATTTANITAKPLTITATASNKVYDRTATAQVDLATADDITGDAVTLHATTATFNNATVGTNKPVNVTGLDLQGSDRTNYALQSTTAAATADITPAPLTATASATSKVYDGSLHATVTVVPAPLDDDDVALTHGQATFDNANVGDGRTVTVPSIAISGGAQAGNYVLANTQATATANITAKPVTAVATADDKTYDGNRDATVTLTAPAKVSGDELTFSHAQPLFDNKHAGTNKTVTVTGITLGGAQAGNYSLGDATATATAAIDRRDLTVAAAGITRQYDGSTDAQVTLTTDKLTGDDVTAASTSRTFADKHVGTGKEVNVSGITIDGTDAGNYRLTATTAQTTAAITAKPLTVTATGINRVYDRGTTATVTLATDDNLLGDDVDLDYAAASFGDKVVGTAKPVSVSGITVDGGDRGNYALQNTTTSTTANITAAPLTATFTAADRDYDGTNAATVELDELAGVITGDEVTLTGASGSFADKHVGTDRGVTVSGYQLGGDDGSNYSVNPTAGTEATIRPIGLTASAAAENKAYDGNDAAQVTLTNDRLAGDDVTLSFDDATFDSAELGDRTVTVTGIAISGGDDAGNYHLTSATTQAPARIYRGDKVGVTIEIDDKVYDGTDAATVKKITLTNVQGDDDLTVTGGTVTFDTGEAGERLATWTGFRLDGERASNYELAATSVSAPATIAQKSLTVSAAAVDKVYDGSAAAQVSLSTGDLVAGDVAGVDVVLSHATAVFASKHVGSAKTVTVGGIALGGPKAGNYSLVSQTAQAAASISRRALTVGLTAVGKTYDGTTAAPGAVLTHNVLAGDEVQVSGSTPVFSAAGAGSRTVSVTGIAISGADAGNYQLAATSASAPATIAQKSLTVSAAAVDKVYDGSAAAQVSLSTGDLVAGDVAGTDVVLSHATAGFANKAVGAGKTVSVGGIALGGPKAGNYSLVSQTAQAAASISRRALTVGLTAVGKTYDGTTAAPGAVLTHNVLAGDEVQVSGSTPVFSAAGAGSRTVSVTGIAISGADAGNYQLTGTSASAPATIAPRPLTVTANGAAFTQGAAVPQLTSTITGYAPGEGQSVLSGSLTHQVRNSANQVVTPSSTLAAGVYRIVPGGLTSSNYAITFVEGELNVAAAAAATAWKPNGMVSLNNRTYAGGNVINRTGAKQTLTAKVKRGAKRTFFIRVRNDGLFTDTLRVKGCGNGAGQTVRYLNGASGSTAITSKVVGGSHQFANVAPGAVRTFRAVVTVGPKAKLTTRTCAVTVTSANRSTGADTVAFKVTAVR